jgi:hypothetical protein
MVLKHYKIYPILTLRMHEADPLSTLEQAVRNEYFDNYRNSITWRGLFPNRKNGIEGYVDILPDIEGKSIVGWLDEQFTQGKPLTIGDVGFGKGYFLIDLAKRYGNAFRYIAYGNTWEAMHPTDYFHRKIFPKTIDLLARYGIEIIEGNVLDIDQKLKRGSIDMFVMSNIISYVVFPRKELFRRMISCLTIDGTIQIADQRKLFLYPGEENHVDTNSYLQSLGYTCTIDLKPYIRPNLSDDGDKYSSFVAQIIPIR